MGTSVQGRSVTRITRDERVDIVLAHKPMQLADELRCQACFRLFPCDVVRLDRYWVDLVKDIMEEMRSTADEPSWWTLPLTFVLMLAGAVASIALIGVIVTVLMGVVQ
jgi:hypothetical protein